MVLDVFLTFLLVLAALFLGLQSITLLSNLVFFPVLKAPSEEVDELSSVSILVPARNEAHNLPRTLPRLLEQTLQQAEVVVLDDGSTDGTRALLEGFARDHPRLRVLAGKPLPDGWSGKNWACHQLAGAASGSILIFTDADVYWEPGTLEALLAFRAAHETGHKTGHGAEFVSVWPRQLTGTLAERLMVPVIDLILLGFLPYLGVKWSSHAAFSAGNGQLMLWTREGYARVGGHAAFRGEVLEDVRMGQRAKGVGLRVALALGGRMIATRMYRGEAEMLEGFAKNILAASGSRGALLTLGALNTLTYTLAWPLALLSPWWLLIGFGGLLQRALTCLKTRRSPLEAPLQPFMVLPLWRVAGRALRRKGYQWKGRVYT